MPSTQPTILIKKKDGTQVRMTMAEFVVYKKNGNNENRNLKLETKNDETGNLKLETAPTASRGPAVAGEMGHDETGNLKLETRKQKNDNLPMVETEQHLATTAPVKDIFVDEAAATHLNTQTPKHLNTSTPRNIKTVTGDSKLETRNSKPAITNQKSKIINHQSTQEDYSSLLEEELPKGGESVSQPVTVVTKEKLDEALGRLSFPIESDLRGRWESLIISRIKNVRDDDQLKSYLQKSKETGGLGLNDSQTEEAIQVIKMVFNLGRNFGSLTKANKKLSASAVASSVIPKLSVNSAVSSMKKMFNFSQSASDSSRVASSPSGKPILHDVVVPPPRPAQELSASAGLENKNMSPIDELGAFTLTDFRRLSKNADEAGQLVQKKFAVLKVESYLLFLQAVTAWRESPFYRAYQQVLEQALKNSETLKMAAGQGSENGLNAREVEAMVEISKSLSS